MSEDHDGNEVEFDASDYVTNQEDLATAGLWDPTAYHFRIESMTPQEKEIQSGERAGQKYKVITGRLVAFEHAEYDEDGHFEGIEEMDPERSRFQDFPIKGRGLQLLKSAYRAVTGRMPNGRLNEDTGRFEIDLLGIAEELVGSEVWNKVFHGKPNPETGMIYDKLTYTFTSKPPQKIFVPKKKDDDDEE
jgi:hypothetical protein